MTLCTGSAAGDVSGTKPENVHDDSLTSSITWNWSEATLMAMSG